MCGIFGLIINKKNYPYEKFNNLTNKLFILSEERGKDAAGIFFNNKTKFKVLKKILKPRQFVNNIEFKKFKKNNYDNFNNNEKFALIGQCRLATFGNKSSNENNQPVEVDNICGVHNGLITNILSTKDSRNINEERFDDFSDTKFLFQQLNQNMSLNNIITSISKVLKSQVGIINIAFCIKGKSKVYLFSNNGSLFICNSGNNYVFASEKKFLKEYLSQDKHFKDSKIQKLKINNLYSIDYDLNTYDEYNLDIKINKKNFNQNFQLKNNNVVKKYNFLEFKYDDISNLKKCNKCILPETYPFIAFDKNGICNYCKMFRRQKVLGIHHLEKLIYENNTSKPKILFGLSGGRDSCFALHKIKNQMNIDIIAYTYDWGLTTDKARINQSKLCSVLNIEHIIRAADIDFKRKCIKNNIIAWLKKPHLGMVPIFFVGDKLFYYYGNKLLNELDINILVDGAGNQLEQMEFKIGFCGINQPLKDNPQLMRLPLSTKMLLTFWYSFQFLKNPSYINSSLVDSSLGFVSSFFQKYPALDFYDFYKWNENEINNTLNDEYGFSVDTSYGKNQWRMGDGQTAFTNYIWYTIAGFSEFDNFRSNQIREGEITREEGLELAMNDNQPKVGSLEHFFNLIDLKFEDTINKINSIKKLY